ncbi:hypothetical protein SKAU_G00397430 [Synaphobranchus kaupii]|uniref:Uncharacterized protein n=1 Tax=Synaphobranchus kaupii TaxID=118154 RepID=A0A9Q1E8E0_SYNKA|nr:hypothetical protein SKAU_G00397430 [Synaphobranchus kaupii]
MTTGWNKRSGEGQRSVLVCSAFTSDPVSPDGLDEGSKGLVGKMEAIWDRAPAADRTREADQKEESLEPFQCPPSYPGDDSSVFPQHVKPSQGWN